MRCSRGSVRFGLLALATGIITAAACRPHAVNEDGGVYGAPDRDSLYFARERRHAAAATQGVDFSEKERRRYQRVELMIQAKFPGVQVFPVSGGYSIRIRGTNSLRSNNEPLIVVDGFMQPQGWLSRINPIDVERIEVIKDGAASFYGMRGANGVIIVHTIWAQR